MERVNGTFRRQGRVVAEEADVWVAVAGSGPQALWYGSYRLPSDAAMDADAEYDLELADGRHGRVTVSQLHTQEGYHYGGFTGNGPLLGSAT